MTPLIEELLNALRNNPEVREAIRRELLPQELLELPEKFAKFAAETNRRLENLERGQEELRQGQKEMRQDIAELRQGLKEVQRSQAELERKHEGLTTIVMGIREDLRPLKAAHARNAMKDNALEITLAHNCLPTRELTKLDLYRMMRDNSPGDISRSDQESFRNADLVVEAGHEETGEVHYFAVEASFTGGIGDIERAVRNAGYLARFTGSPAHAVVACVSATPEAESVFGQDECARYEIPRRLLEAE